MTRPETLTDPRKFAARVADMLDRLVTAGKPAKAPSAHPDGPDRQISAGDT